MQVAIEMNIVELFDLLSAAVRDKTGYGLSKLVVVHESLTVLTLSGNDDECFLGAPGACHLMRRKTNPATRAGSEPG